MTEMEPYILGDAEVQYGDWRGTVAADGAMVSSVKHLSELAGVDVIEDNALIIGVNAGWSSSALTGVHMTVHALVYEPGDGEEANMDAILKKYPEGTAIPVRDVLLHDVTPEEFALAFNSVDVRMRSRFLGSHDLRVVSLGDHPEQPTD